MVAVTDTARNTRRRVILSEATGEVHWNAVVAGAVIAVATQILLMLLGIALGVTVFGRPETVAEAANASWVGYAWWAISGICGSFAGGWTAGNVSSAVDIDRYEGAFQGFMSWALTLVLLAVFLTAAPAGTAGFVARIAGPLLVQTPSEQAIAMGALWAFIALLIGAVAALVAGYFGSGLVRRVRVAT